MKKEVSTAAQAKEISGKRPNSRWGFGRESIRSRTGEGKGEKGTTVEKALGNCGVGFGEGGREREGRRRDETQREEEEGFGREEGGGNGEWWIVE